MTSALVLPLMETTTPTLGCAWETPVWPQAGPLTEDPPATTAIQSGAETDDDIALVQWVDESSIPRRIRVQRLRRVRPGVWADDGWLT